MYGRLCRSFQNLSHSSVPTCRVFLFFAGCCTVGTLFIYFLLPECKGLHVEEVYEVFQKHWVSASPPSTDGTGNA